MQLIGEDTDSRCKKNNAKRRIELCKLLIQKSPIKRKYKIPNSQMENTKSQKVIIKEIR
jgi:hypothetical protein